MNKTRVSRVSLQLTCKPAHVNLGQILVLERPPPEAVVLGLKVWSPDDVGVIVVIAEKVIY